MAAATRALLLWNPVSGRKLWRRELAVQTLQTVLRAGGWQVDTAPTDPHDGAMAAARAGIAAGYSTLVACGGDGTLNQVAHAIATSTAPVRPVLAVAPLGTANVFAQAAGCPLTPAAAAAWLLRARPQPVMLGRAQRGDQLDHFICMASIGLDAHVVHTVTAAAKHHWGKLAYGTRAVVELFRYPGGRFDFTLNDASAQSANGLIFGLTRFYGGRMRLGKMGCDHAILLALHGGRWMSPLHSLALAVATLEQAPGVTRHAPHAVDITTPGLPLQLDGEAAGFTPVRLDVAPQRLQVLLTGADPA